jgi:hypothetical protein
MKGLQSIILVVYRFVVGSLLIRTAIAIRNQFSPTKTKFTLQSDVFLSPQQQQQHYHLLTRKGLNKDLHTDWSCVLQTQTAN